jgi:hypothetical protein
MRVQYTGPGLAAVVIGGFGPRKFFPSKAGGFISEEMPDDEALWWAEVNSFFSLVSEPQPTSPIMMDLSPDETF